MKEIKLQIEGMTCASCAAHLEKALNAVEGVQAEVNIATHTATVGYHPEKVNYKALSEAVKKAGFHIKEKQAMTRVGIGGMT